MPDSMLRGCAAPGAVAMAAGLAAAPAAGQSIVDNADRDETARALSQKASPAEHAEFKQRFGLDPDF